MQLVEGRAAEPRVPTGAAEPLTTRSAEITAIQYDDNERFAEDPQPSGTQ